MVHRREVLGIGAILAVGTALPSSLSKAFASSRSSRFSWKLQPPETAAMTDAGIAATRATIQKNIDGKVIAGVAAMEI